jgi:hypothetical protein
MKSFRYFSLAAIIWGLVISCSNEIDLYPDDAPEMLYVVGCLDGAGTLQQVKIRKFIAGNEDAGTLINDPARYLPDPSIRVYLGESNGKQHPYSRIIHPPQTGGVFAQDSNAIYELAGFFPLPERTFTLRIEDPASAKELSSRITSMERTSIVYPEQFWVDRGKFNLTDQLRPFSITYTKAPATLITVFFKYVDILSGGDTVCRKACHSMPPHLLPHLPSYIKTLNQTFTLNDWWLLFNRSIPDDPKVDSRQFYRFDFSVWAGDSAIAKYLDVAERFADNRKQSFNNIEGGMGLFYATSHAILKNVSPYEKFHMFLSLNDTTSHLKFSQHPFTGVYVDPDSTLVNPFLSQLR